MTALIVAVVALVVSAVAVLIAYASSAEKIRRIQRDVFDRHLTDIRADTPEL